MKPLYRLLVLILMAATFTHCQKELGFEGQPDTPPVIPPVYNADPITANLQGNIYDEAGAPAPGVMVTVGTATATTDANGYFRIADAQLDKSTALVVAEKSGYFKGIRVFQATSGTNQVVIKLIKKVVVGTITASAGGDATLSNGAKVTLPAGGVVIASSGAAYTGDVKVYAAYIDPSANDIGMTVPGSFMAVDKTGKRVVMTSYGMMAVELESTAGEKLQIKSGSTATLTTPIPAGAQSSAQSSISLWSVDENTGLWKEEGTATKQGNNYVGQVSHFSFWNCDVSQSWVTLHMTLLNAADSTPLVHVAVRITRSGTGWQTTGWGWTDSLGQVGGIVPDNETLSIEVLDACYNVAYSTTAGPLTQNTDLGNIYLAANTPNFVELAGTLKDCGGNAVTNGYALITYNNMVRYAAVDSNGHFSVSFFSCSSVTGNATIIGIDQTSQQQSSATTVAVTAPTTNAGNITACGTSSAQYINYTIDGTNYTITSTTNDSITGYYVSQGTTNNWVMINGNQNPAGGNNYIGFQIDNPTGVGTFPLSRLYVQNSAAISLLPPSNATLTSYANAVGEFYEGSFTAQYTDSTSTHNISSSFRVRRSF